MARHRRLDRLEHRAPASDDIVIIWLDYGLPPEQTIVHVHHKGEACQEMSLSDALLKYGQADKKIIVDMDDIL